jgi:hypothetical protein
MIAGSSASFTSTANTTAYVPIAGSPTQVTTESTQQIKMNTAGTFSDMGVRISTNSVNTATVFMFRLNAGNTSLTFSVAGSTSGWFEDTTNSVSVAVNDLVAIRYVPGTTGTFVQHVIKTEFDTDDSDTNSINRMAITTAAVNTTLTGASTTYYWHTQSQMPTATSTVEADQQSIEQYAGTYRNLGVRITANSRTNTTTVRLRKNGANGNQAASITSSGTGWFEDTSNTDSVVANDLINYSIVNGTGTSAISYAMISVEYQSTTNPGLGRLGGGYYQTVAYARATNFYLPISGALRTGRSTESESQIRVQQTYGFKGLTMKVTQNSITNTSTLTLRLAGADTALMATATAATTGTYSDLSDTVTASVNDLANLELTTGTGSGSQTISLINVSLWSTIAGVSTDIDMTVETKVLENKFITKV